MKKEQLIALCRYYKGEKENPWAGCFDAVLGFRARFWNWENLWVERSINGDRLAPMDCLEMFDLTEDYIASLGIPKELANLMIYYHIGLLAISGDYGYNEENMRHFLENLYLKFVPTDGPYEVAEGLENSVVRLEDKS